MNTLDQDAMSSYICNNTLYHSLGAGTQISFDTRTLGLEGVQRTDNPVLDMNVHLVPLPTIGGKSVPHIGQRSSHPQVTVSKSGFLLVTII